LYPKSLSHSGVSFFFLAKKKDMSLWMNIAATLVQILKVPSKTNPLKERNPPQGRTSDIATI
jgi:hypothetical protein